MYCSLEWIAQAVPAINQLKPNPENHYHSEFFLSIADNNLSKRYFFEKNL